MAFEIRPNPFGFSVSGNSLTGVLGLLAPAWVMWIVTGLLLNAVVQCKKNLPEIVRDVMEYGKLREGSRQKAFSLALNVPKRYFTHFYIWGMLWIVTLNLVYIHRCIPIPFSLDSKPILFLDSIIELITGGFLGRNCSLALTQHHFDVVLVLSMLTFQVSRRLYECFFVSVLSPSARMHPVHYILGIFYYPAVAFTAILHLDSAHHGSTSSGSMFFRWNYYIAMGIFLWASLHQHRCHKILANLRNPKKKDHSYHQPNGDWFELVSCPHYLAEVLIYVSMLLVFVRSDLWSVWWLVVVYVVSTLGLSARQTHAWYKKKFEDYPNHRYAIIPWLL